MLTLGALSLLFLSSNSQTSAEQICILGTPADETGILFDGAYTVQNTTVNGNNYYKKSSVGPDMYLYMSTTAENCPTDVSTYFGDSYCWCLAVTSDFTINEDDCEIYMAVNNTDVLPSSSYNDWHGDWYYDDYDSLNVTEQTAGDSCQAMEVTDDCFQLQGAGKKRYYWFDSYKYNGYYRQKGIWGTSYEYTQVGNSAYLFLSTTGGACTTLYDNDLNITSDLCWCVDYGVEAYESYTTCDIQAPIDDTSVSPANVDAWYRYNGTVWDDLVVTSVDAELCEKSATNQIIISLFTFILSIFSITFLS